MKKVNPIRAAVEAYIAGIALRAKLALQTDRNELRIKGAQDTLARVQPGATVAYTAKGGDVVEISAAGAVRIVPQGPEEMPAAPLTNVQKAADVIAALLAAGKTDEAQATLTQAQIADTPFNPPTKFTFRFPDSLMGTGPVKEQTATAVDRLHMAQFPPLPQLLHRYRCAATGKAAATTTRTRDLMTAIRDATAKAITKGDYNAHGQALSRARGELVEYISELEHQVRAQQKQIANLNEKLSTR